MTITFPTLLSIFRLLAGFLILLGFLVLSRPAADVFAFGLFVCAAITDFVDGYLARKLNLVSELGKVLDSIADKIIVIIAWVIILAFFEFNAWITLPIGAIIFRELFIAGLREYLASKSLNMAVTFLAKLKTTLQMFTISLILFSGIFLQSETMYSSLFFRSIGESDLVLIEVICISLIWLSAVHTLFTGWLYFNTALGLMGVENNV